MSDEKARLELLAEYGVLDTGPDDTLDELVQLASAICETPVALVSLVDETRQWFKAKVGLAATETPREYAFCAHAIAAEDPALFTVEDARVDPRFLDNPLVTGDPNVVFYAGAPLVAEGGAKLGTLCVIDRTPRRLSALQEQTLTTLSKAVVRHLQALRREKESLTFRSFVEASGVFMSVRDLQERFDFINPAGRKLVGLQSVEAARQLSSEQLVVGVGELETNRENAVRSDVLYRNQASGELIPVAQHAFPIRDVHGQIVSTGMIARDLRVSNQEDAERLLTLRRMEELAELARLREADLTTVTDSIPLLVSFVDADARYRLINHAYEEWFGQTRADLVGRKVRDVVGEAAWARLGPSVERGLAGERFDFEQYAVPYRYGGTRDIKVSFIPHQNATGGVDGYVALIEDISVRRRLEQEREVALAKISQLLSFEQQLIGIVSHDIRNPLNVIGLSASLLGQYEDLSGDATKLVQRIRNASERATRLVKDLLDFTQARLGGGLQMHRRPVALQDIVQPVVDEVVAAFPSREVALDEQPDLRGEWDPERLAQVIQNLLGNAIKYSTKGSLVQVSTRGEPEHVVIRVHNVGSAIPPENQATLFEPFERAGQTDSSTRSVGLGLYIVKQIVDAHGGSVHVQSTAQEGTTFRVRLPRVAVSAP